MIKRLLLLLTLVVAPTLATTTQLTGTLTDAAGNPVNGTACFRLPVNAVDTSTSRALSPRPICFPVSNGTFPVFANLVPNDVIQPLHTYYQARVTDQSGALVFNANYVITTGGGTFNIGLAIPTVVTTTSISYLTPVLVNGNNVWSGTNTFSTGLISQSVTGVAGSALAVQSVVTTGNGPNISIQASGSDGTTGSTGGGVSLVGGAGGSPTGFGGNISLLAGNGAGAGGTGGSIILTPGSTGGGPSFKGTVSINAGFFYMSSTTFAFLGAPTNGAMVYCSDCTIANPCAGAGTGAIAKRLNGVWVCN